VTGGSGRGWPFLVARGREIGYQLLLAPDFILAGRESGLLMAEVQGEVLVSGPAEVSTVAGPVSGPMCVVRRTARVTRADVGATDRPEAPLLDRAGRPILLGYGFVCRGTRVTAVDEQDLSAARSAALAAYQRFYPAEEDFVPEPSGPYPLHSTLAPMAVAPARSVAKSRSVAPSRSPAPAWSAEVLPATRIEPPGPPVSRSVLSVAAAALLVVLAVGIYLVANRQTAPADVAVPKVVGLTQQNAEQLIRHAQLKPVVVDWRPDKRPAGTVIETKPPAAQRVRPGSQVGLVLSIGPAPRSG